MTETTDPTKQLLTADDVEGILAADDLTTIDVFIPEWKRTVRLRQMTAADAGLVSDAPKGESLPLICALSIVDANGNRLFKDYKRLMSKSAAALARVQEEVLKLNGMDLRASAIRAMVLAKNG